MSFSSFCFHSDLLARVNSLGYSTPTPVQQAAIPEILKGNDVLAGAQTGTGKTAAFALPIIQVLIEGDIQKSTATKKISVLVLTPTRELAQQVHQSFMTYRRAGC